MPLDQVDVRIPWIYPDEDVALKSLMSTGPVTKAVLNSGEKKVRQALINMLKSFKLRSGGKVGRKFFKISAQYS